MKPEILIIIVVAVVMVVVGALLVRDFVLPSFAAPSSTAMPTARNPFASATKTSAVPRPNTQLVAYTIGDAIPYTAQTTPAYASCVADREVTPTPTSASSVEATATAAVTEAATAVATKSSAATVAPDLLVVRIVAEESEACYQVGEVFLGNNQFGLAVGVTKTIDGFVQIDRANVANSQLGEINIDISKFESDSPRRDGIIRSRWLESSKYPTATFSDAKFVGLPARALVDGEKLSFQIVGNLKVHDTVKEVTFNVTGSLTGTTLVITGYTDTKMSDFGFEAPSIGGFVKANDEIRIVLNFVAKPE